MEPLLGRVQGYCSRRSINVRQLFGEFDHHNVIAIDESLFCRALSKPRSHVEDDIALIVQKYRNPERHGLVKYHNLFDDLDALGEVVDTEKRTQFDMVRDMSDYLPHQMRTHQPLQDVMDRIRVCHYSERRHLGYAYQDPGYM